MTDRFAVDTVSRLSIRPRYPGGEAVQVEKPAFPSYDKIAGEAAMSKVQDLSLDELKKLIHDSVQEALEDAIEDLTALASPSFLISIEEARSDVRAGRLTRLDELG